MKFISRSLKICRQNFRKWQTDYRVWATAILIFVLIFEQTHNLSKLAQSVGISSTLWYYPFLYSQYHMKLILILPLLLVFCNAPFVDENALFVILRSKRKSWISGQILYIITASAVYNLYILLCTLLTSLPDAEVSSEWGKILNTMSVTTLAADSGYPFLSSSRFVLTYFSPLQAVFFTFILSWFMCIMLGMIIYILNTASNTKYLGAAVSSFLILLSCYAEVFGSSKMLWFSPVSWCTVDQLDVGGKTTNPTFTYCMLVYITIIAVIALILFIFNKRWRFEVSQK